MNSHAQAVVDQWLAVVAGASPSTRALYSHAIARFFESADKPVGEITPEDAVRFMTALNASGLSPATRASYVSAARSFLKFAEDIGILNKTPLSVLKRPKVQVTSFNRFLDGGEAQAMLGVATDEEKVPIGMMLICGLRVSEVIGAVWRDVYRDPEGRIGIRVVGKGHKGRVLALPAPLWEMIVAERVRLGLSSEVNASDKTPLVPRWRSRQALQRVVTRVSKRAGLSKSPSNHWLRHSHATLSAVAGTSVHQLQVDLGHSSPAVTAIYVNWAVGLRDSGAHVVADALLRPAALVKRGRGRPRKSA